MACTDVDCDVHGSESALNSRWSAVSSHGFTSEADPVKLIINQMRRRRSQALNHCLIILFVPLAQLLSISPFLRLTEMNHGKSAMHRLATGNWLFINSINVAPGNWCGISRRLKAKACGSGGSVSDSGSGLKALISTLLWLSSATINRKGNFQSCKCV